MNVKAIKSLCVNSNILCINYLTSVNTCCFISTQSKIVTKRTAKSSKSQKQKMTNFFKVNPNIIDLKKKIPKHILNPKFSEADQVYLIDPDIAQSVASHVIPLIESNTENLVCVTNAGLGHLAVELLKNSIRHVRLYEPCAEFREQLKELDKVYPGQIDLFSKDIFLLSRYAHMDKMDNGDRVEQLLKGLSRKSWTDEPVMSIIGTLSKLNFIKYLIHSLALHGEIVSFGRIQIFALMRPKNYTVLTATPENNLHTYQSWSVLSDLFFDIKLLDKYPKNMFLPWEVNTTLETKTRYFHSVDPDKMYLVQISFKKHLPAKAEDLLALYFFVRYFFGRGKKKVIPVLEKLIPGSGINLIVPQPCHTNLLKKEMSILTEFGELTPQEILSVFEEVVRHPSYKTSPLMEMIEGHLVKNETIQTDINEAVSNLEKNIIEDIECKINEIK